MKRIITAIISAWLAACSVHALPAAASLRGDVDGDGTVSVEDAQAVLNAYTRVLSGRDMPLTEKQQLAADVNGDTHTDAADAQLILMYYVRNTLAGIPTDWDILTEPAEPEYDIYDLNNIGVSKKCFDVFVNSFLCDLFINYPNTFVSIDIGYGDTYLGAESCVFLESLNCVNCDNEYINTSGLYKYRNIDDLNNCKYFLYHFKTVQDHLQCDVDYSQFTIDKNVGNFLNQADQAYRDGNFELFMSETFGCANVSDEILKNSGAMAILYSYDNGKYLNFDEIDSQLNVVVNHICEQAFGNPYKPN